MTVSTPTRTLHHRPKSRGDQNIGESALNHFAAILVEPEAFGCTPSLVSCPWAGLKPVNWSTTVIGDAAVLLLAAQAGICASRFCARVGQSLQPDGCSGMICATITRTFGFTVRTLFRIAVYAFRMFAGVKLFQTSFVPKCISTMSAGRPSNQVARSRASETYGSLPSAPPGRVPVPAA